MPSPGDRVAPALQHIAKSLSHVYESTGQEVPPDDLAAMYDLGAGHNDGRVDVTESLRQGKEAGQAARRQRGVANHDEGEPTWAQLMPLSRREQAPSIDRRLLPISLRSWLCDVADRACLPVELVAVPAIVAISSLIGSHIRVRPEPQSSWTTPPNLWGAIVAPSGVMKTHAISAALKPIHIMEMASIKYAEEQEKHNKVQRVMLESELAQAKKRKTDFVEITNLTESIESLEVTTRRYQTNDPTTEKLGELFKENPRGLLLERDELAGWLSSMAKTGQECARAFYLEAWGGDSAYTFDRIGRGTIVIPTMCLSVIGAIQPGKLAAHIDGAVQGGDGDDGLLQRIQLLVWPDATPDWLRKTDEPDISLRDAAHQVFYDIDNMCRFRFEDAVRLADDAQPIYDGYRDEIETRVRSEEFATAHSYGSHIGKYRGLAPSLALVLWVIDGGQPPSRIDACYVEQAVAWCRWLELHARKTYAAELAPQIDAAQALAARIQDGSVAHLMSIRQIKQNKWKGLTTEHAVKAAVDELIARGWAQRVSLKGKGRPSIVLSLHPELRGAP